MNSIAAAVNVAFSFAFAAYGGQPPLSWNETGTLPAGLSLSQGGVLSGTPALIGSFPIALNVQDSAGQNGTPQQLTVMVTVAGGDDLNGNALASAELYHPSSKTFAALSAMLSARDYYTATLLPNGKVLIAGGGTMNGSATGVQATAELFDLSTGSFAATGSMSTPHVAHTATLLSSGKVLITGGINAGGGAVATAEVYDPSTRKFTLTGDMNTARYSHTATLLGGGTVLLTGGNTGDNATASAETYDPNRGTFTVVGNMSVPRVFHTAVLLSDGTVLVVGGLDQNGAPLAAAELYAPGGGQFSLTGGLQSPRYEHTATLRYGSGVGYRRKQCKRDTLDR